MKYTQNCLCLHFLSIQISLDELGFYEHFITPLRENYLNPLCKILYPDWTCNGLDSHKAFVVVYKMDQDVDLSTHYDNAEVTLNVSLGKDFEEGSLYIGRMRDEPRLVESASYNSMLKTVESMVVS